MAVTAHLVHHWPGSAIKQLTTFSVQTALTDGLAKCFVEEFAGAEVPYSLHAIIGNIADCIIVVAHVLNSTAGYISAKKAMPAKGPGAASACCSTNCVA